MTSGAEYTRNVDMTPANSVTDHRIPLTSGTGPMKVGRMETQKRATKALSSSPGCLLLLLRAPILLFEQARFASCTQMESHQIIGTKDP